MTGVGPILEEFSQAEHNYRNDLARWEGLAADLAGLQSRRRDLAQALDFREAELRLNPGIDGKNAEERNAQIKVACRADPGWQQLGRNLETSTAAVQLAEAQAQAARDGMALAKRIMEFSIARVKLLAIEGGEAAAK